MTDTRDRETIAEAEIADASTAGKELAPAGRVKTARELAWDDATTSLMDDVFAHRGEIAQFLTLYGEPYERFEAGLRVFLMRQAQNDPDFFGKVTAISFMEALLRCAKDGLIPDGKEAAIAAYKDRRTGRGNATYMPMRDGFVKVLWRTGLIRSINDQTVTVAEEKSGRFEYEEGDRGFIRHRPLMSRKDADEVAAAYCVIELTNGGLLREVVPADELQKIARMSRSPAREAWKHQMHRKAAIRRIMGKMPREKAIVQLLEHDAENYDLDAPALRERQPSGVAARLPGRSAGRPGFAPGHAEAMTGPLPPDEIQEVVGDTPTQPPSAEPITEDDTATLVKDFITQDAPAADDLFPGDRPSLGQRADTCEAEIDKATTQARLDGIKRLGRDLWADLDRFDPERLAEINAKWDAKQLELQEERRR